MDLAEGHLAALRYVENTATGRGGGHGAYSVFNLGTGNGYSVLEMVEAMKKASGRPLPYVLGPRFVILLLRLIIFSLMLVILCYSVH